MSNQNPCPINGDMMVNEDVCCKCEHKQCPYYGGSIEDDK